eukprot:1218594-Rhodomonas_salina.1
MRSTRVLTPYCAFCTAGGVCIRVPALSDARGATSLRHPRGTLRCLHVILLLSWYAALITRCYAPRYLSDFPLSLPSPGLPLPLPLPLPPSPSLALFLSLSLSLFWSRNRTSGIERGSDRSCIRAKRVD